jgi:hypothetical protein
MTFVTGLQCRAWDRDYPNQPLHVSRMLRPLEVRDDYNLKGFASRAILNDLVRHTWRR